MTATSTFAGLNVEGEIHFGHEYREQKTIEEFLPLFLAVVTNPQVKRFGWKQYTPYFNDGDECVFGASNLWIETIHDEDPEENDNYYSHDEWFSLDYGDGILGEHDYVSGKRVYKHMEKWVVDLRIIAEELDKAIEGGHFDAVLLTAFGNHAEVTVYPGEPSPRIEVEFYHHD